MINMKDLIKIQGDMIRKESGMKIIEQDDTCVQGDIHTQVKLNLRVNLDATIEGNEEDALKFKKDVEEKIQSVIDDYKAEATWRLD